jgi:hypothetical protein
MGLSELVKQGVLLTKASHCNKVERRNKTVVLNQLKYYLLDRLLLKLF